jgi:hypothetical protein
MIEPVVAASGDASCVGRALRAGEALKREIPLDLGFGREVEIALTDDHALLQDVGRRRLTEPAALDRQRCPRGAVLDVVADSRP